MHTNTTSLFTPIQVGDITLSHRVVLAPLTRFRCTSAHVPLDFVPEYYSQRASTPGTLLISEATIIAPRASGFKNVPGIWSDAQIAAWKKVSDAVHARGSYIFLQLWALGRTADPAVLKSEDASLPYVSASDVPLSPGSQSTGSAPRPLTTSEVHEYVQLYSTAAKNAVYGAGMDGVEIHGANGYLIDQFTQDITNKRTDEYGGSIENRCRFALEVIGAVTQAVGVKKTGFRISPWSTYNELGMANPIPTFSYLVAQIREKYPDFAYLHAIEPRINGSEDNTGKVPFIVPESNNFARDLWRPKPFMVAGGFNAESAKKQSEEHGDLVAIGRYYISNPDLPRRIKEGVRWTPYTRRAFYTQAREGYIDYPVATGMTRNSLL